MDSFEKELKPNNKENKVLKRFLFFIGIIIVALVIWSFISHSQNSFEYKGVKFDKVNEIAPYRTGLPVVVNAGGVTGAVTQSTYYFYLRKDPRESEDIPFNGEIILKEDMVISGEDDLTCGGDGIIAIANLAKVYSVIGTKIIKDSNASCDELGRYIYLEIKKGNETKIEKTGPACYIMSVNNCEILKVTEKFMVEILVEVNKDLKK